MDETGTPAPQSSNRMMPIIIGVVLLLLVGGGIAYFAMQQNNTPAGGTPTPTTAEGMMESSPTGTMEGTVSPSGEAMQESGNVKTFTVTGSNFAFSSKEIRVNEGDTVRINFVNSGGTHDFVIDEFDVATKRIQGGQSETVEFVADNAGTYEFYCSVGNHRQMGMKGNLIVQ